MKLKSALVTIAGLSLAAVLFAQTNQGSTSQSNSKSGNGQSSSSSSGNSWATGSSSSSGSKNGFANGSGNGGGSGMGFGLNSKPSHAILYSLDAATTSASAKQLAFNQHSKYMSDLQTKGKVLLFGPWRDLPGSMAIVIGPTDEEALNIARNDPAVRSGSLSFEVRAWNVATPAQSGFPGGMGELGGNGSLGSNGGGSNSSNNSSGGSTRNSGGNRGGNRGGN